MEDKKLPMEEPVERVNVEAEMPKTPEFTYSFTEKSKETEEEKTYTLKESELEDKHIGILLEDFIQQHVI